MKRYILLLILMGIIVAGAYLYSMRSSRESTAVISLLHSEPMAFLVTRRVVTQIVVQESDIQWYSQSRAVLWATVNLHYGCNLEEIRPEDIKKPSDGIWRIRLPPPKLLDFSIVNVDYISKDTLIAKAEDILFATRNRRMMQQLQAAAIKFANDNHLLPTREEIAADLNRLFANSPISRNLKIRFEQPLACQPRLSQHSTA